MNSKTILRNNAKTIRKTLDMRSISEAVVSQILALDPYNSASHVMMFYPMANEINILGLLKSDKNFYFPRVNGDMLEVCPYKYGDELKKSEFNVFEPCTDAVDKSIIDIVFVPALMADKRFYRLGYGGGFYDRFLSDLNALKLVVVPEELVVDTLITDSFDVKCDGMITQKKASF